MLQENKESLSNHKELNKELMNLERENIILRHNNKMEELQFERQTNKLFHDWALERFRIQNAETRRNLQLKSEAFRR